MLFVISLFFSMTHTHTLTLLVSHPIPDCCVLVAASTLLRSLELLESTLESGDSLESSCRRESSCRGFMSLEFPDLLGVQGVDLWWMKRERLERGYSRPHTPHVNTSIHTTPEHIQCDGNSLKIDTFRDAITSDHIISF